LFNTMSAKTLRTITLIGHSRFGGYGVDQYVLLVHSVIIYDRVKKVKDFRQNLQDILSNWRHRRN
jgi:hypothetical protein